MAIVFLCVFRLRDGSLGLRTSGVDGFGRVASRIPGLLLNLLRGRLRRGEAARNGDEDEDGQEKAEWA